jgi:hypothetical protein
MFRFNMTSPSMTLDEASRMELGFPHEFYTREMVRGMVYGGMRDRIVA